jgi:transcription-repair coupling factor (superfamily II helicase)
MSTNLASEQATDTQPWHRMLGSSLAYASILHAQKKPQQPLVLLVEDSVTADRLTRELAFYRSDRQRIYNLPDWETLPYDLFSPHSDIISERLTTLHRMHSPRPGDVFILTVNALVQRLCPADYIAAHVILFKVGETLDIDKLRQALQANGYSHVSQVMEHGEYSIRGSIIDLYPAGSKTPYRFDLFDDEIESIREFNPNDQISVRQVDSIEILPATEYPTDERSIVKFRERYREQIAGDPLASLIYSNVSEGTMPAGIEYYIPLFFDRLQTVFDYLPRNTIFIAQDSVADSVEHFWQETEQRYEQRRHDIERPLLEPAKLFIAADEIRQQLIERRCIYTSAHKSTDDADNFDCKPPPELYLQPQTDTPAKILTTYIESYPGRLLFVAESAGRREVLNDLLKNHKIFAKNCSGWQEFTQLDERLCITVAPIERGLVLVEQQLCVVTENQVFGQRVSQYRRRKNKQVNADQIITNLTDLNIGTPVVHFDHGVGRYLGLQKLHGTDFDTEFLTLEYAGGDKLYVPVQNLHLISRYTGAAQENAPLHKLGTEQWQKAKRKAAQKASDVAAELLDIYARRASSHGYSYSAHTDEYNQFAQSFPFEETPDQETAIKNILADMESPQPMDRVVCGDVGFGKTEVAMRAAFVAAMNGKQVAILVPTTLLAQQHYQNFSDRFADWPVKIAVLSRFNSKKQQTETLQQLADGKMDLVIGTHKLLQKDIKFANLGLIIVDEEHRFGVKHKEQLKSLRSEVDILTLTATPIPRTLNMSLAGIRDLSIISTPPLQRHSINTFVTQWNDNLIQEACHRELKRGGQIYFLHNEVKTIERALHDITELVPEARAGIAHGQMPDKQLEEVMLDFYHQRYNILVCTTIIESGIDVPTANTIIINRADKLGLAQLHQIRGRVGRSHHRAYAYLITPPASVMTSDAKKRMQAIESLEDLGVGFTLATHDLEIRGAGELLCPVVLSRGKNPLPISGHSGWHRAVHRRHGSPDRALPG